MTLPAWWQDWRGECVAIVGAGPSAKSAGVEKLKDRIHVIAINESWRLCPWAEILYACEAEWWLLRADAVKHFAGIKLMLADPRRTIPGIGTVKIPQQHNMWVNEFLFETPGVIGSGGHSGFQAINLAAQFGATGIALVAFDMCAGGGVHWHGKHPSPLRNPDDARFLEWRNTLDAQASKLTARGADVVNCSAISTLTAFPKVTIEQALERWGL